MKKTIIFILILCNMVSFAQIVTPIKTRSNLYDLQPTPFLDINFDSSRWKLANYGYEQGQFIKLGDSTIYCTQIGDIIYIGVVKGDSLLILDSIYNLRRVYSGVSTESAFKTESIRTSNLPNIAVYKDTLLINRSLSVYKWYNGFLGSENNISSPSQHPGSSIHEIYLDHSDSLIVDISEGLFKFRDTGWHKLVSYDFNSFFYRHRYFKDTLIKSPKLSYFSNNSISFIVGDSVIKQIPGSIARIIDSSIYFLNNDGFICKYYNGKIDRYDADPRNRFYSFLDFAEYNGLLWVTAQKDRYEVSHQLYYFKDSVWHRAHDKHILYLSKVGDYMYTHGERAGLLGEFAFLEGNVGFDLDSSCSIDGSDRRLNQIIYLNDQTFNSSNGTYSVLVTLDKTHTIKCQTPLVSMGYQCSTDSLVFKPTVKDSTYKHDFLLALDTTISDLELSVASDIAVRGFYYSGSISITNNNLNAYDSVVVKLLNKDNWSDFYSSFAFTQKEDTILFTIPLVSSFETVRIPFTCIVDANVFNRGDTFCITARVIAPDSLKFNNYDTVCNLVMAAYDPNSKTSFPQGVIKEPVEKIDYTIQFQNLGDYKATTVRVIDTIDTRLPIEYIRIKGTSHPETYSLEVRNNVLIWTFKGINLPDSASNPEGSKGYISYEAKVKSAFLKQGDQIDNKAEIYFDYEKPIVTNFASVYLRNESSFIVPFSSKELVKSLMAYPNPFGSQITIENNANEATSIFVYNIQGKLISETKMAALSNCTITLNNYPNGLYLVTNNKGETLKIIKTN